MTTTTDLIPVFPLTEQDGTLLCNARDLHKALSVGRDFSNWIKDRIEKFGFELGPDYVTTRGLSSPDSGSPKARAQELTEYHLTLDMAKELAMLENSDLGRQVRRYFIAREKQAVELLRQAVIDEREKPLLGLRTAKMQIRASDLRQIGLLAGETAAKLARATTTGEHEQLFQTLKSYNTALGLPAPLAQHFPRPADAATVLRREFWELVADLGVRALNHSGDARELAISLPHLHKVAQDEGLLWPSLEKPAGREALLEALRADPRFIRYARITSAMRSAKGEALRCVIFSPS
jgi:phage anti-repressor protein